MMSPELVLLLFALYFLSTYLVSPLSLSVFPISSFLPLSPPSLTHTEHALHLAFKYLGAFYYIIDKVHNSCPFFFANLADIECSWSTVTYSFLSFME